MVALCACAPRASIPAPPRAAGEPALWVVRDADSTIYLFGTIHIRKPGAEWGGPTAKAALESAHEVWTEISLDDTAQAKLQEAFQRLGLDPEHSLSQQVAPERRAQLAQVAAALNLPPGRIDYFKPWVAAITVSLAPMVQAGYDGEAGVDKLISRAARTDSKRMRAFETAEQQMQMLAGLPTEVQLQMLYDALDKYQEGPGELQALETAWESGDENTIHTTVSQDMIVKYPVLYDTLFRRRNAAWADILTKELAGSGIAFVAVGAGHLSGPDSVQHFLEARGHPVERVTR